MLREEETVVKVFVCDTCGKESKDNSNWYSFEAIEEEGLRLFEVPRQLKLHTKTYTRGRKVLHFCSVDCMLSYMKQSMEMFAAEMNPPKKRTDV